MNNPIGNSTLDDKKARYLKKRATAHNSSEPGWVPVGSVESDPVSDWKRTPSSAGINTMPKRAVTTCQTMMSQSYRRVS